MVEVRDWIGLSAAQRKDLRLGVWLNLEGTRDGLNMQNNI